ncbi:MAG: hypothetical protein QOG57_3493, partial [Pseudonocardiales bacterium]|nr:hypothetical protein [Pseudonocardiales bacterium]
VKSQRGRDSQASNCSTVTAAGRSKSSARSEIHITYQRLDTIEDAVLSSRISLLSVFSDTAPRRWPQSVGTALRNL